MTARPEAFAAPAVVSLDQIKVAVELPRLIAEFEDGFRWYSEGKTVVPPVGFLGFEAPPGEVHLKYGYIAGDAYYVVKISSGFFENVSKGLPSTDGLMLVFLRETGQLAAILLDHGYLTDLRTAVAGAVAAKYLAPREVTAIGVFGTGVHARLQVELLETVTPCRHIVVWGRNAERLAAYTRDMTAKGYTVSTTTDSTVVAAQCNLIVTTTASTQPVLAAVRPGTHITAMGADGPGKQELSEDLVANADVLVADSRHQCVDHGEFSYAVAAGRVPEGRIIELGAVIATPSRGRTRDDQVTIADLTGVAVQDIQVAKHVYARYVQKAPVHTSLP